MKTRIMYIESKAQDHAARIGRIAFSKSGRSVHYKGKTLLKRRGNKANYIEVETGEWYWISGPKKDGKDRLRSSAPVEIDEDVREEYWRDIRGKTAA